MSRESLTGLCGLLLTLVPFLGIPLMWKTWITVGFGALFMLLGFGMRYALFERRRAERVAPEVREHFYHETRHDA